MAPGSGQIGDCDMTTFRCALDQTRDVLGGVQKPIFLALLSALVLGTVDKPAHSETLRWARVSDAPTLDPHSQNVTINHTLLHHIYETLVLRDADGKLLPRLATEWRLKEGDPTTWVFKLRPNVKFHDGADLTADDVVFSLDRARSAKSNMRQIHAAVEKVTATDPLTVEVKMRGPSPLYPGNLTNTFIMSKRWAEANKSTEVQQAGSTDDNFAVRHANGTGPYVLQTREPDVRTVLKANEKHWAPKKPEVTEIVYLPIADAATRIAALLSGEVDLVQDVPVQDIERLERTPGVRLEAGAENRIIFFGYRFGDQPLRSSNIADRNPINNPKVREAIDLAIDRDAIKRVVMRGRAVPTGIAAAQVVNGWTPELATYSKPDIAKAKALLAEAGYPQGFTITVDTPNNRYVNDEATSQAIVAMLARIGIRATLASKPVAQFLPLINNSQSDFYLLGWGVPTFDSAFVFNDLVHSKTGNYGAYNAGLYSNSELDKKIESLEAETDTAKRNRVIAEIWKTVKEERVLLPVYNPVNTYAMKDRLSLPVHPENQPLMTNVSYKK